MLQGGKRRDEWTIRRRYQEMDSEAEIGAYGEEGSGKSSIISQRWDLKTPAICFRTFNGNFVRLYAIRARASHGRSGSEMLDLWVSIA